MGWGLDMRICSGFLGKILRGQGRKDAEGAESGTAEGEEELWAARFGDESPRRAFGGEGSCRSFDCVRLDAGLRSG